MRYRLPDLTLLDLTQPTVRVRLITQDLFTDTSDTEAAARAQDRFPFRCPTCGQRSAGWAPYEDALDGYCGTCHTQTDPPTVYQVGGWTAGLDPVSERFGYTCMCGVWRGSSPQDVRLQLIGHPCLPPPTRTSLRRWRR